MKRNFKKLMIVMAVVLSASGLFAGCGTSDKDKDTTANDTVQTEKIYVDAQMEGEYVLPYQELTVSADTAEKYGYEDSISSDTGVSALDALVAMHEAKYGDAFTSDTCEDYLTLKDGWISKAFENLTSNWSVVLNGEAPHSDSTSEYGGYEALMVSQAQVTTGDVVELVCYQDTTNYSDNELWFMQNDARVNDLSVTAGEEISLMVEGYNFCMYGAYGNDQILSQYLKPIAGITLGILQSDGSISDIDGAVSDSDGKVSFTLPDAGTYIIVAHASEDSGVIALHSALTVTVTD